MTGTNSDGKSALKRPRSLPVSEWPDADQRAWQEACRPGLRLMPGGAASSLAAVSRDDFARRYGAFLGFLQQRPLGRRPGAARLCGGGQEDPRGCGIARSVDFPPLAAERVQRTSPAMRQN